MSGNGTAERGGFTEAYLTEEGFTEEARKREVRAGTAGCRGPLSAAWGAARRCTDRPRLGHLPCPTYSPPLQDELPENLANSSRTIAWWQGRQAEQQARLNQRQRSSANGRANGTGGVKAGKAAPPAAAAEEAEAPAHDAGEAKPLANGKPRSSKKAGSGGFKLLEMVGLKK